MTHTANTRRFASRMGRGFWSRARRFSESAKPATGTGLASDGTTGADSGLISGTPGQQPDCLPATQPGVQSQTEVTRILGAPSPRHSAGGGVCCVMLCQIHADRWATLAVIAVFLCGWAVAVIRANRSSRPHTPTRGNSSARPRLSVDE